MPPCLAGDGRSACGATQLSRARGARRLGRFGYYEAIDFTRTRLPDDARLAIVSNFMAHHQGMTIVSIANALHDGRMRERFHREPIIVASELLLHRNASRAR